MDKKSRKIIAAVVAGLMLVMSFAEVPAVFAAGETGEELEVVDELNGEKAPEEVIDPEAEGEPEVIEGEPEEEPEGEPEEQPEEEPDEQTVEEPEQEEEETDLELDEEPVDPLQYPNGEGQSLKIGETELYPRLYADSLNEKYYENYAGNIKLKVDVRWSEVFAGSLDEEQETRATAAYQALADNGWEFKYTIMTTAGDVVQDEITYDQIKHGAGVDLTVEKGKAYYLKITGTNAEVAEPVTSTTLGRTIFFIFPKKPTKLKATCATGCNTMKVTCAKLTTKTAKVAGMGTTTVVENGYAVYEGKSAKTPSKHVQATTLKYLDKKLTGPKSYTYFVRGACRVKTGGLNIWVVGPASSKVTGKVKGYIMNTSIRPIKWKYKLKSTATVYSNKACTSGNGSISKGTTVYVLAKYPKKIPQKAHPSKYQVELRKDGKVVKKGWVKYGPIKEAYGEVAYKNKHAYDYSKEAKESFVNRRKYSSSTKYLCWVNTYTQRVNIFKGKKGKWKLYKSFRVTSGRFYHLTALSRNQTIHKRMAKRTRHFVIGPHTFSPRTYYMKYLSFFSKGNSFHTHCWHTGSNKQMNHVKGNLQPGTKGCMRMSVADAKWIYTKIPMRTRVVTY